MIVAAHQDLLPCNLRHSTDTCRLRCTSSISAAFQHELVHTIEPQMSAHIRKWFHRSKDESPLAEEGLRYKSLKPKKHHVRLIKFETRRPNEAHLLNLSLHTVSLD